MEKNVARKRISVRSKKARQENDRLSDSELHPVRGGRKPAPLWIWFRNQKFQINEKGDFAVRRRRCRPPKWAIGEGALSNGDRRAPLDGKRAGGPCRTEDQLLAELDVTSYYPSILLKTQPLPQPLGPGVHPCVSAARRSPPGGEGPGDNRVEDAVMKLVINGCFRKAGFRLFDYVFATTSAVRDDDRPAGALDADRATGGGGSSSRERQTPMGVVVLYDKKQARPNLARPPPGGSATPASCSNALAIRHCIRATSTTTWLSNSAEDVKGKGVFQFGRAEQKTRRGAICRIAVERHLADGVPDRRDGAGLPSTWTNSFFARSVTGGRGVERDELGDEFARWLFVTGKRRLHPLQNERQTRFRVPTGAWPMQRMLGYLPPRRRLRTLHSRILRVVVPTSAFLRTIVRPAGQGVAESFGGLGHADDVENSPGGVPPMSEIAIEKEVCPPRAQVGLAGVQILVRQVGAAFPTAFSSAAGPRRIH